MKHLGKSLRLMITLFACSGVHAGNINTAEILSKTAEGTLACLQWMPVGLCVWLDCSLFSCSVQTSLKIGHYNPDLVVSSYNELGKNPWTEIRQTLGIAQHAVANGILGSLLNVTVDSAGNRSEGSAQSRDHRNLIFRETDAIGHPQQLFADLSFGYFCPSEAQPFTPYFQSAIDALAWRQEVPEIFYPASVIPGLRELGHWPANTWGGVFPRTGWTTQAEEPKGAALNAQRAGDIVTRTGQPHLYLPLEESSSDDQRIWPPGPLLEADARTGTWQMLLPEAESGCAVFGENDLASLTGWGGDRVDAEGDYAWNLWRPYQCCERRGQLFLFSIDWMSYPL
ncbi:MAG: TIGR03756 family integrating conjugative element protein [Woeseiaceae bacterium]